PSDGEVRLRRVLAVYAVAGVQPIDISCHGYLGARLPEFLGPVPHLCAGVPVPCALLGRGGLDVQVLLELDLVPYGNIECQDHWHSDSDTAALEGIDRGVGLLSQRQLLGMESRSVGLGLVDPVPAYGGQLVCGTRLEPIAGGPGGAILADLSHDRAPLLTALTIGVGVSQFDFRQRAPVALDSDKSV